MAANYAGHFVAVAAFESVVEVWDLTSLTRISRFNTILDFGGRRLCLQESDKVVAVASYGTKRLAAHDTVTGDRMWEVELSHPAQRIICDPTNNDFLAALENGPLTQLDSSSGARIREYPGVKSVTMSSFNPDHCLQEFAQNYGICTRGSGKLLTKLERSSPILLAAELSHWDVFVSEFDEGITSFSLESGARLWNCNPRDGWQYENVSYSEKTGTLFAVRRNPNIRRNPNKRAPAFIDFLDAASGEVLDSVLIEGPAFRTAFAVRNTKLVTAGGKLYSLPDDSNSPRPTREIPFLTEAQ